MNPTTRRLLYWTPRILCIAFAAFLAIFALDVFDEPMSVGQRAVALAMHLLPTLTVLAGLAVVWRWEWIGALLFPALAVVHVIWSGGRFDPSVYAVIDGPLVLAGILFAFNWRHRATLREALR
jgi:hypothetical protein